MVFYFSETSMKILKRRCFAWGNWEERGNQRRERENEQQRENELQHYYTGIKYFICLCFFWRQTTGLYRIRVAVWQRISVVTSRLHWFGYQQWTQTMTSYFPKFSLEFYCNICQLRFVLADVTVGKVRLKMISSYCNHKINSNNVSCCTYPSVGCLKTDKKNYNKGPGW